MTKLDARLAKIAEFVMEDFSKDGVIIDIGCDHALLPCFLAESGFKCVIAADINDAPLSRGKLASGGLDITFLKSDGFKDFPPDIIQKISENFTAVIIAGMGAETILEIIESCPTHKNVKFVLQPMSKKELLEEKLVQNNFTILKCEDLEKGKRLFTVFSVFKS